ncbi:MAG TPA: GNAT family N-acetyltransferase [Longimicrobiaceae bacterium]|jgi:GNAT superfamily N-acetyltransferase|nr:GNAT family N-acetyltransferase [Longimicrobiaceae bacterium]
MTGLVRAPLSIRLAARDDVSEIARLLTELGHPTDACAADELWDEWSASGNAAVVAAAPEGGLSGVATLHRMVVLHRPKPVGRITALVVDPGVRGQGIGRALVAAAEDWLTRAGCGLLEITSNLRLVEAHAFYEHIGYERTSIRLAKPLTYPSA